MTDIAVIMPMHNGRAFITSTLRSILDQQGVRVEVIVSDDASTDGSPDMVRHMNDPRVRVVANLGKGVPAGLNTALAHVTAPLVCRCDHDDHYTPGRLARQVRFLREHPEFGAVCGAFETMTHDGAVLADMDTGDEGAEITRELRESDRLRTHLNTWAMRTEIVRGMGGFRDFGLSGEDNDLQLRMGEATRVWYDPGVVYRWRLHASSITHTQPTAERVWAERLAWVLREQRRARGGRDDLMDGVRPPPPADLRPQPVQGVREQVRGILTGAAWRSHARGERARALRLAARALAWDPAHLASWKALALLTMRRGGRRPSAPARTNLQTD